MDYYLITMSSTLVYLLTKFSHKTNTTQLSSTVLPEGSLTFLQLLHRSSLIHILDTRDG